MKTLQINELKAKELFKNASKEFKETLIDTFGEKFFSEKITDRVKTFEDACSITGDNPYHAQFSSIGTPDEIAFRKLKVIAKAINEGWTPDWSNENQRKWHPWFQYFGSGFRFYAAVCDYSLASSTGGSQLCFKSEELANYAGNQFIDLYNQLLN